MLLAFVIQLHAQNNTIHPSVPITDIARLYQAPKVIVAPNIDGDPTDAAWGHAVWKQAFAISPVIDWVAPAVAVSPEGAFSGPSDISFKYKIIWDDNHYYMLMRYTDDKIIYSDKHNGYRTGYLPSFMTGVNIPTNAGLGDGTVYQSNRMDQINIGLTPHTPELQAGTQRYSRLDNGLLHTFYPAKLTESTNPEAILWAPKHNPVSTTSGAPQDHVGTVAGIYNSTENAYYIEFRDDDWKTLFSSVRTKLAGQKIYSSTVAPSIGDKFLLQAEINDADGITNRRDYVNYGTHITLTATKNPFTNLSEALVVELVQTLSGLNNTKANGILEIFPNPTNGETLNLNSATDVQIYNISGNKLIEVINSSQVNISNLKQGIYLVKDKEGNVNKLVRN